MTTSGMADRIKHCLRCGWEWLAVVPRPVKCPHCQAKDWDEAQAEGKAS